MNHILTPPTQRDAEPQAGDLVRSHCGALARAVEVKEMHGRRCLIAKPLRHPHINIGGPIGRFRVIERRATKVAR